MTIVLAWSILAYKCVWWIPKNSALKDLLCEVSHKQEILITTNPAEAVEKLKQLGPEAKCVVKEISYDERGNLQQQDLKPNWNLTLKPK